MKNEKFITPVLSLLFLLTFSSMGLAQESEKPEEKEPSKREKIEQLKIAFITTELDLTTEESEKFWPIYNEMIDKIRTEKKAQKELRSELKEGMETLTDTEIKTKMDKLFAHEQSILDTKESYHQKIADVIGQKKAVKLLSLEQRFKKELLNTMRQKRDEEGKPKGKLGPRPPRPE